MSKVNPVECAPLEPKNRPFKAVFGSVEMAGIEPASERIDPRISTSVVGLFNLA